MCPEEVHWTPKWGPSLEWVPLLAPLQHKKDIASIESVASTTWNGLSVKRLVAPRPPRCALASSEKETSPTVVEGRCHPFRRSRSHLEEADDTGTPSTVTEVGFERMTLVVRDMGLLHGWSCTEQAGFNKKKETSPVSVNRKLNLYLSISTSAFVRAKTSTARIFVISLAN